MNLDKPAKDVDITSAEYEAMLGNLQANIFWAHGRNFARHIFLRFTAQPAAVKTWIHDSAGPVTTAKEQFGQIARRRADPTFDGGLVRGFFLSAKGYEFLGFDPDRFASGAFRKGIRTRMMVSWRISWTPPTRIQNRARGSQASRRRFTLSSRWQTPPKTR